MPDIKKFEEGDKVHYTSPHGSKENGIVKQVGETTVWVVYKCNGEWDKYRDYTGAATNPEDLKHGWYD